MAKYEFSLDDLTRLRFAISPMWEVVASLRRLRVPSEAGIHLPWLNDLRSGAALQGIDLSAALSLTPTRGYVPDFLSPPPTSPLANFDDEIALVRKTPPKQVENDLRLLLLDSGRKRLPPALEQLHMHPRRTVRHLADQLELYWQRAIEPHWPRIKALLEADIAYRAKRLTEGGASALFADLHPLIQWREANLHVEQPYQGHVKLAGRGLLLVPSAFAWVAPATITEPPWQPTLIYPARGVATLWESGGERTPEALARIVGRTRAALLSELDAPRTTTDLARLIDITAGGASQHLGALKRAGLVAARRDGRVVLYVRTPVADSLVAGSTDA